MLTPPTDKFVSRWVQMKEDQFRGKQERRPHLASDCDNLADSERWRRSIIKEVSKKIAMIQNGLAALSACPMAANRPFRAVRRRSVITSTSSD